jgi:putative oxidoreductase
MFPQLSNFADLAFLLLRIMVAIVFGASGINHLRDPESRAKDIGVSKAFTIFLGVAELAGALGVAVGVLTQAAAAGLIVLMLGAIQKKMFVWHSGFWGKYGTDGWHYDLIMIVMCLTIIATDGGRYVLMK